MQDVYSALMMSVQVTRHNNLFAHKYKEAIMAKVQADKNPGAQMHLACYKDVQKVVMNDYVRMGCYSEMSQVDFCQLLDMSSVDAGKRGLIGYMFLEPE